MDPIAQAEQLRDTVIRNLARSKEWSIAKAADDMVAALGGARVLPIIPTVSIRTIGSVVVGPTRGHASGRLSHGDAAVAVLREAGEPLPISALLERIEAKGAIVGGERKEINLSSSLSRDDRFASVRVDGVPVWTLTAEDFMAPVQKGRALQLEDDYDL